MYRRRYITMKIPEIIPVSDLRQDAAAILKRLQGSADPLVVTQRGRAIAVIQSMDAYERRRTSADCCDFWLRASRSWRRARGSAWGRC
jgi:prevent-host-death family protein